MALIVMFSFGSLRAQSAMYVEFSSVDEFFRMANKIGSGEEPTESEWRELFETQGYKKCIAETFKERDSFIRKAMDLAFNPVMVSEKDSIISIPVAEIVSDWEALLLRVMLDNFLDIKENKSAMEQYLQTVNDEQLLLKAGERLKSFLVDPVDSLITPIPVSLICMEPDALSLSGSIVWDFNSFYKQSEESRVNTLAHEMFHAYRKYFKGAKYTNLINLIDGWQEEGIADLIDKKTLSDLSSEFIRLGLPQSYVDEYHTIYQRTQQMLKELEKVTLSFINNEISEKEFNSKLSDFDQFGGHPNAFYMTTVIKNAGFEKDLIRTFASPVELIKLYNKSVEEEYALGNEFMDYIEKIK